MFALSRFTFMFILVSVSMVLSSVSFSIERILYYDTFEEFDTRNGGFILPEGEQRSRTRGCLFFTEREIEAPTRAGETRGLARFIPDPSGLSLVSLLLEDNDDELGDGSFGADGSVSLWESIILDQGDRSGRAIISWMAIPFQDNETGGTMFPETDSRIDAGPEGINLVGFGGVTREFDTGDPIPGQDFTEQIIINREGAVLTETGVGYTANVPTFFVLDFDLDSSTYNLIINGVLVSEDLPFFDIQGETGKTLRELELISNARGLGTFIYDSLFQIDPDYDYSPVPFRTPVVADQSELIPLFMESFDDEEIGIFVEEELGDLFGSWFEVEGTMHAVEDESWQTPARGLLTTESIFTMHLPPTAEEHSMIRSSFSFTPTAGSALEFAAGDITLAEFRADGVLAVYQDAANDEVETEHEIFAGLPHWVTVTLDTQTSIYFIKMYRAASPENAQTEVIEIQGSLPVSTVSPIVLRADDGDVFIDEVLVAAINPFSDDDGTNENRYHASLHHSYIERQDSITTSDPTGWSFQATELQQEPDQTLSLIADDSIEGSARISWTAIPNSTTGNSAVLTVELSDGNEYVISGITDGFAGIADENGVLVQQEEFPTPVGSRTHFLVVFDLTLGAYSVEINGEEVTRDTFGEEPESLSIITAALTTSDRSVLIDDVLVVSNHFGALFDPQEFVTPVTPETITLLFEEDFENNPARSELVVDEFNPRSSGLPIPTRSTGFSDLAETDIPGTRLTVGAPSADAAYIEDPDGSSLYSLFIGDRFAPQDFTGFETAIPFNPISTLRTIPYAFVVADLLAAPNQRYVTIRWSGIAGQTDQTGLAFFTDSLDTTIPVPNSTIFAPSPAGTGLAAFGDSGTIWAETDGDGILNDTGMEYEEGISYRFIIHIDQETGTYDLLVNENLIVNDALLSAGQSSIEISSRLGWFTTLENEGNGENLQQSEDGGGLFVIDDIRVYESNEFTSVNFFAIY